MPTINKIHSFKPEVVSPYKRKGAKSVQTRTPLINRKSNSTSAKQSIPLTTSQFYSNSWKDLNPFIGGLVKVVYTGRSQKPIWSILWTNNNSAFCDEKPVPKSSLIYKYIASNDPIKQKHLEICESILFDAFLKAKKFLNADDYKVPRGFEVYGRRDAVMQVGGEFGVRVSYDVVDSLLHSIIKNNTKSIYKWSQFIKGCFAHEMVHLLQDDEDENSLNTDEIASHAIELLATEGDNPISEVYFKGAIEDHKNKYNQDMVTSLKVLQVSLLELPYPRYKPKSHMPSEICKAIKSIPKATRYLVLQGIAKEIIDRTPIELLRIATLSSEDLL